MIIVSGTMEFEAADFVKAKQAATAQVRGSISERGCIRYLFSEDIVRPNTLCFYEEWSDLAALNAHKNSEHNQLFRRSLEDISVLSRQVKKYRVDPRELD